MIKKKIAVPPSRINRFLWGNPSRLSNSRNLDTWSPAVNPCKPRIKIAEVTPISATPNKSAIALARWKGRKSSRAQVLNDLYQNLRPIEPTQNNPEIIDAPLEKNQDLSGGVPKKIPVILPPDPVVDKNKSTIETDVKAISGLNRNGQIALVLSRISSNLSLGKILGKVYKARVVFFLSEGKCPEANI